MAMTAEEIYENFTNGDTTPLTDVEREVRDVVVAYRAASYRFAELNSRMTSAWSGEAASGSGERALPLATSLHDSADLLETCAGSHGAQTTAFNTASHNVQPVPPLPDRPAPMDMVKAILTHGPAAPFEQVQSYKDGVEAHNAAAARNHQVMDEYYWITTDNQEIPDQYPQLDMTPDSHKDTVTSADSEPWDAIDVVDSEPGIFIGDPPPGVPNPPGSGSREGGGPTTGGGWEGGGSGPGGGGAGEARFEDLVVGGSRDPAGPGDPAGPPYTGGTTPNWVMSPAPAPDFGVTEPPRNPPPSAPNPPNGVVPGLTGGPRTGRHPDTTVSAGVKPGSNAFDPARTGPPPGMGANWAGSEQQFGPGEFGPLGSGGPGSGGHGVGGPGGGGSSGGTGSPGSGPGGRTGSPLPGPVGGTGGGSGRAGMPGGMGMTPPGTNRDEDKEHQRPEYLFEPDPDAIFGTDQAVASPVIGAAWRPERFDDDQER